MRLINAVIPLTLGLALIQVRCTKSNDPVSPDSPSPSLVGTVYDVNGVPLADVAVHYVFRFDGRDAPPRLEHTNPSTVIGFTLPAPSHVTAVILRWFTRQVIDTLIDAQRNAGNYVVSVDSFHLTNGVYLIKITTDSASMEKTFYLLNSDWSLLLASMPLTRTNPQGEFSLPLGIFGFGEPFQVTSATGTILDTLFISRSIDLVLTKEGYETLVQPIVVDTSRSTARGFVLHR